MAVNVSARQFHNEQFVDQLLHTLERSGADPTLLKLEITESLLLDDVEATIVKMRALKAKGVCFSLDDFGTGYSSLSYLKRLPLDQVKIDKSFVRDVLTDANDATIARTIVVLAQSLGLSVIAEGVETEGQRGFLSRNDCHHVGYHQPAGADRAARSDAVVQKAELSVMRSDATHRMMRPDRRRLPPGATRNNSRPTRSG